MNIGKNIRRLRRRSDLTQCQLADKLGVTAQAVSKWENNMCIPDVALLPEIAELFGVSIDELFGDAADRPADINKKQW
jgi:transcriptional regulator with XRE-family HTH domain